MQTSTKNKTCKTYSFFLKHKSSWVFEGLNNSLAQSAGELWLLAKMVKVIFCGIGIFTKFLVFEP